MQTYSHTIITAVGNQLIKRRQKNDDAEKNGAPIVPPLNARASVLGSFMPDFPLTVLALLFIIIDLVQGNMMNPGASEAGASLTGTLFNDWFFNDNGVKALHNLFHAPILTVFYTALGYWGWKRGKKWGGWLFWFGLATTVHTAIDIPLHYDDGPLIFFPFDWETRFHSPVSYWDPERGGVAWSIFEHSLDVVLMVVYFVLRRRWNRAES